MALADGSLEAVFREVFQNDTLELSDSSTFEDVKGWDSLGHVNLIAALEEEYHTKFTVGEIMEMNSVGAIREVLVEKSLL